VLGLALGRAVAWLRERARPAPVEIAVSLATPYAGSLASTALGVSVVVTIVAAALVIAAVRIDPGTGEQRTSAEARVSAVAFWEEVNLVLSAVLFVMAGRALPEAMAALQQWPLGRLLGAAAGLLALVLLVQFAFSLAAAALPHPAAELGTREEAPRVAVAWVMAWASTRSVVGLVIALSVPTTLPDGGPFAARDLILALSALAIVGSVLLQGLTLGVAVRRAGLAERAETEAERRAAREAVGQARAEAEGGGHDAARRTVLGLRAENRVGDEVAREMLRETDLHQRATEESPLPGAGPPNP
jgi:NhaP-type Na+/H+ or K+/H+ antiporter